MSGQICGMCGRLIAPDTKAGWTSIAGFAALYCESCLRAHAQEFPSARIVGKSARQEIGAARRGLDTRRGTPRPEVSPTGQATQREAMTAPYGIAGENPAAAPTPEMPKCPKCGRTARRSDGTIPQAYFCDPCGYPIDARTKTAEATCHGCGILPASNSAGLCQGCLQKYWDLKAREK